MWKKIEAVLRPYKVQEIIEQLEERKIHFYLEDCVGFGRRLSPLSLYKKESPLPGQSLPRTRITLFLPQQDEDWAVSLILERGDTGIAGDGKIFITPVIRGMDIETREIYD